MGIAACAAVKVTNANLVAPDGRTTIVVLNETPTPEGTPVNARVTTPTNPFSLDRLIVELALAPWESLRVAGVAASVKSRPTVILRTVVLVFEPLVPAMVKLKSIDGTASDTETSSFEITDRPVVNVAFRGVKLMETPAGRTVELASETVPLKVFKLVTVTFVAFEVPCRIVSRDGLGVKLNPGSLTVTGTLTIWTMPPTVAFNTVPYTPGGVVVGILTERVEDTAPLAGRLKLLGLMDGGGPGRLLLAVRFAVPANPLKLVRVILEVAEEPWIIVRLLGLVVTVNPRTEKVPCMLIEWSEQ